MIAQDKSKKNSIFGTNVKNYMDLDTFGEKNFPSKLTCTLPQPFFSLFVWDSMTPRGYSQSNSSRMGIFCNFMVYPQKFEDCEIRRFSQARQKNVIFWIY